MISTTAQSALSLDPSAAVPLGQATGTLPQGQVSGLGQTPSGLAADWNGTTGTDNTAALQTAINSAFVSATYSTKHRRVVIPTGKYALTSLTLGSASDRNGIVLEGDGGPVVLIGTQDGANVLNVLGNDVTIRNITIDRKAGHTTGHGLAILSQVATTVIRDNLENVVVQNQPQDGVSCVRLEHSRFANVACYNNGRYGIALTNSAPGNPNTGTNFGFENILSQCKATGNGAAGLYMDGQSGCTIQNFEAFNNNAQGGATGRQIHLDATSLTCSYNVILSPDVENYSGDALGIGLDINGTGNVVLGGSGYQLKVGIYLRSAKNTEIRGFSCSRASTLSGAVSVLQDSGAQSNIVSVPFGPNMAGDVSYDAAATQNTTFSGDRLEMVARRYVGWQRTLTANSATPSVALGNWFKTANTNPTSVTNLSSASRSQTVTILVNDANTTFVHGSGLNLRGGLNWSPPSGATITLACWGDITSVGEWYETGRTSPVPTGLTMFAQSADGVPVTNTIVETALNGSGLGTLTLPANFWTVGKTIRFRAEGYYSSAASSAGTLIPKFKAGSVVVGGYTPGVTLTTGVANRRWKVEGVITCRSTGASGSVSWAGQLDVYSAASAPLQVAIVNTSPTTIDTTASADLSLTATFSVASASNTITCTHLTVEAVN